MKQFDTVKNNEWVPTEEDLEGSIKVVDALPTASASELGTTYLLNGAMEGYTKTHFYKCVLETVEGVQMYVWSDLNVGRYSVGNCSNIQLMMFDDGTTYRVLVAWKDPDDITVGSEKIRWKETRLVHQVGHMPVDVNDATDTFVSNQRDAYATLGLYQTTIAADSRKHYFKLFPVSEDGAITNDDTNGRVAGYNYALTTKNFPWTRTGAGTVTDPYIYTYLDIYSRSIDPISGNYTYTKICDSTGVLDPSQFTYVAEVREGDVVVDPGHYNFKTGTFYYEYLNCFITWRGIQELIQNGEAETYFAIGSVITLPYHGDFGEMVYEVVDYDNVINAEGKQHTMTLQSKYLYRWWDYNGGVVFDTNERAGVITADTGRNNDKVYFSGQICTGSNIPSLSCTGHTSTFTGDNDRPKQVATETQKWEKRYALYPESVHDASGYQSISWVNATYHTVSAYSWQSSYYECELPYINMHRSDLQSRRANSSSDASDSNYLTKPLRSPSDLMIDLNSSAGQSRAANLWDAEYKVLPAGTILKYGRSYATKNGYENTYKALGPGDFIPGTATTTNSHYESSSRETYDVVHNRVEVASQNARANSAKHEVNETSASDCNKIWGGFADAFRMPFEPTLTPRNNGFADHFMRVPYLNYNYRLHDASVKYFIPVEPSYQMARRGDEGATQTYYCYRSARLRDATEDIALAVNEAHRNGTQTAAGATSIFHGRTFDKDYFKVDLTRPDQNTVDLGKVMRELVPCPSQDVRFIKDKRYYHVRYVDITTVTQGMIDPTSTTPDAPITTWPTFGWYYKKTSYNVNGVTFDIYSRCRGNNGALLEDKRLNPSSGSSLSAGVIYMGFFDELEVDVDYNVHQMVPTRTKTPLYVTKKSFSTVASPSGDPSAQNYYTLSAKTGLYVKTADTSVVAGKTYYTETNGYVEGTDTSPDHYWWSCDDGVTQCATDFRATSTVDSIADAGKGYSGYDRENYRVTDIYQATIGDYTNTSNQTREECSLYWKMPNTERVAYGNHVWAQSNLRMYFNGPMDATAEYVATKDSYFVPNTQYYYQKSGGGYAPLTFGTTESGTVIKAGSSVTTWQSTYSRTAYNRYVGGSPVGYKLDINSPDKHHDFGLSPVMQYQFNNTTSKWEKVFAQGTCWWSDALYYNGENGNPAYGTGGCPSVNNGLRYDRLASMYWSGCVLKGKDGAGNGDKFYISTLVSRSGGNGTSGSESGVSTIVGQYSTDNMILRTGVTLNAAGTRLYDADLSYNDQTTTTQNPVTFGHIQPRQSFLHGFLDCRYKRSGDTAFVSGKTYYLKNQYGRYIALSSDGDRSLVQSPYQHCLYERNNDYLSDLQDAKEFLDCIVPVVNRNGCYGTPGAYDFYNQQGSCVGGTSAANGGGLGGTICIDKVWLASTTQVNGGNGANNYVWENPSPSGAYYANLKKWGSYSGQALNDARVKQGVSLGAHGTGGYADIMAGAQYWWLRSAGGHVIGYGTNNHNDLTSVKVIYIGMNGQKAYNNSTWHLEPAAGWGITRLSPLITLG